LVVVGVLVAVRRAKSAPATPTNNPPHNRIAYNHTITLYSGMQAENFRRQATP
jgi:hypothetical protein